MFDYIMFTLILLNKLISGIPNIVQDALVSFYQDYENRVKLQI